LSRLTSRALAVGGHSGLQSTGFIEQDFMIHPDWLDKYLESSLSPAHGKPKVQWWVSQ
jgi:hypothetical protein